MELNKAELNLCYQALSLLKAKGAPELMKRFEITLNAPAPAPTKSYGKKQAESMVDSTDQD